MTDKEILDNIYSDCVSGLKLFIDTYADLVYKIVSEVISDAGTREDAEECVADSFIAFYNNIDDVDLECGSIIGYLGVIARRRAINLRCTLTPDDDINFDEYTVEEMSDILEDEEVVKYAGLSDVIIRLCYKEIAPEKLSDESEYEFSDEYREDFSENFSENISQETVYDEAEDETFEEIINKKNSGFGRVLKTLVAMVTLVTVIVLGVIVYDKLSVPEYEPPTTQPTTQASSFNPLLSAITAGNEKLIEELITNSLLITDEVLRFAIESADKISYDSIRLIAEEVRNKYGSTGLDPLLESAIFGDFKSVEDELKNKDESEMTTAEKLAKFFITTFENEVG